MYYEHFCYTSSSSSSSSSSLVEEVVRVEEVFCIISRRQHKDDFAHVTPSVCIRERARIEPV